MLFARSMTIWHVHVLKRISRPHQPSGNESNWMALRWRWRGCRLLQGAAIFAHTRRKMTALWEPIGSMSRPLRSGAMGVLASAKIHHLSSEPPKKPRPWMFNGLGAEPTVPHGFLNHSWLGRRARTKMSYKLGNRYVVPS